LTFIIYDSLTIHTAHDEANKHVSKSDQITVMFPAQWSTLSTIECSVISFPLSAIVFSLNGWSWRSA